MVCLKLFNVGKITLNKILVIAQYFYIMSGQLLNWDSGRRHSNLYQVSNIQSQNVSQLIEIYKLSQA